MATYRCLRNFRTLCTTLFIFISVLLPFSHPLSFSISRFEPGAKNMQYDGDAGPSSLAGTIELNQVQPNCIGRATYAEPLHLWDSTKGSLTDFSSNFSFIIDTYNQRLGNFADGLVFFLAPVDYPIPPGSGGSNLGLFNITTRFGGPQNQIVMVEFDTFPNKPYDPPASHVGININTITSVVQASWNASRHSGVVGRVQITYSATTFNLSVVWLYEDDTYGDSTISSLSYLTDLRKVLPEWVTIGFSASTGLVDERNAIYSWDFSSAEKKVSSKKKRRWLFITEIVAAATLVTMLVAFICYRLMVWKRKKRPAFNDEKENENDSNAEILRTINAELAKVTAPKEFAYQELYASTNGFADDRRLGRGGSGHVYRGILQDLGLTVAVKRIFAESHPNNEDIFINEVRILSRLNHRNLVQLIGWSHNQGECLLVYAYMPNSSLDKHLFGSRVTLQWNLRHKIALGLASALHYLHELHAEQCVLHRDIKAANVLLDADFSTKLGDFGISKLVDPLFRTQPTRLVGTFGYIAPEYANEGRASKESDMFSFGVVALELACGKRTYQNEEFYVPLVSQVWQHYLSGNLLDVADKRLGRNFDRNEMECLLIVGLQCTQPDNNQRLKAGQVMKVLQGEAPLPELPRDMHDHPLPQPQE